MGISYKLSATCDQCGFVFQAAAEVGGLGGGISGKPAELPAVVDAMGVVIEPAKPAELTGKLTAWRAETDQGERLWCPNCAASKLSTEPCEVWRMTRIEL